MKENFVFVSIFLFCFKLSFAQDLKHSNELKTDFNFTVGIDISKPKLMYQRDQALALEFLYTMPIKRRWNWHQAIGFHSKNLKTGRFTQ